MTTVSDSGSDSDSDSSDYETRGWTTLELEEADFDEELAHAIALSLVVEE